MSIKALQDYTFHSKYARYNPALKRRDTWTEAIERVKETHISRYPQIKEELDWAFEQSKQKRVLGSQRALQYAGVPLLKKHARGYNCTVSYVDRIRFFQEAFWLLLCGCGVGFSVQYHHIAKLPRFSQKRRDNEVKYTKVYTIADTIEGWADALGVLLASYFQHHEFSEYAGYDIEFDSSLIRKKGSPLSSGVGKAPGAEPLLLALEQIRTLLNRCLEDGQDRLRPIDAYDILMFASDAVLSGGVRRSATICIFSVDDELMAMAKSGDWKYTNPQRGRSNNSAMLIRNETTREQFNKLFQLNKEHGEPGFVWSDSTEMLVNPCVEVGMFPVLEETGESGWQMCNLCEINGKKCKSEEDLQIACKAAAIIGTAQAAYTDFEYLGDITKKIVEREALLGVSITGIMDNPDILLNPEFLQRGAATVLEVNKEIAKKIGINPCARATCIKPAGTTSLLLGTASATSPHHARRYFRLMQANELEAPFQHFASKNPRAIQKSVYSEHSMVMTICVEVPDHIRIKKDISAIKQLEIVKLIKENWIDTGKVKSRCTQPWLSHNVSNTINIKADEWDEVEDYIYQNRKYFAGISLMGESGDLDYEQAPFTAIKLPAEIIKTYGDGTILASGLIVDGLHVFESLWIACDGVLGKLKEDFDYSGDQIEWVRRAKQFAARYFEGDEKRMCYALKETNNFKLWEDLRREYQEVDFTELIEEQDNTKIEETVACGGGECALVI